MTTNTYAIIDTGYANTSESGTQETMANSGNALSINVESITWNRSTGTSSSSNPGAYADTEVNFVSITNPRININGILDKSDSSYSDDINALDNMCTTKGLKLLYYSSTTDGYKPITASKGSVNHGNLTAGAGVKSLLVRVIDFQFTEQNNAPTKGMQRYRLTIEVTNPKDL